MVVGGWSQVPAWRGPLTFISMLVTGDEPWLSMKPPSLLTLFLFGCISFASFTRRSTYPEVPSDIEVPVKSMQWSVLMLSSATVDVSG